VQQELLARYDFSLSAKSSELDHWLVDAAAIRLDRYRDHHGKKIPRYDRVISALFKAVFDQIMTDENVRTTLRRLRAQNSGTDQGREPVGTNSTSSPVPEPQNVRTNRSK
jgi:transcriptional regulator of met regulon